MSAAADDDIAVLLRGRRVGWVRPRRAGYEALTVREHTLGLYNSPVAAANAVLVVAAHGREMREHGCG